MTIRKHTVAGSCAWLKIMRYQSFFLEEYYECRKKGHNFKQAPRRDEMSGVLNALCPAAAHTITTFDSVECLAPGNFCL